MNFDKANWKNLDINVDSLWMIGPRAKGGKRTNAYHGNFAPQIPDNLLRRYTIEGDIVLDMFMGSGTTLFECETLRRNFIGFDINDEIIEFVEDRMAASSEIKYFIHNCDITDTDKTSDAIESDLSALGKKRLDFIMVHPPYLDIVKFTDKREDLSNISDIGIFTQKFITAFGNCLTYLRANRYFSLVIGDVYRDSEVMPLGFHLMSAIKNNFNCKLKGIVVKDVVGNRAKIGLENLWRYKALKSDYFLFKHEYVFVFKKIGK